MDLTFSSSMHAYKTSFRSFWLDFCKSIWLCFTLEVSVLIRRHVINNLWTSSIFQSDYFHETTFYLILWRQIFLNQNLIPWIKNGSFWTFWPSEHHMAQVIPLYLIQLAWFAPLGSCRVALHVSNFTYLWNDLTYHLNFRFWKNDPRIYTHVHFYHFRSGEFRFPS